MTAYHDPTGDAFCCWRDCTQRALADGRIAPLCTHHLIKAWRIAENHLDGLVRDMRRRPRTDERPPEIPAVVPEDRSLVYYFRGMRGIKIGRTIDLAARMKTLMVADVDVLACEPGGKDKETIRHRQFKDLRYPRTEFFRESPELLEHVAMIRRTFGDPIDLGDSLIKYRGELLDESRLKR